jgi:hypothetical protein
MGCRGCTAGGGGGGGELTLTLTFTGAGCTFTFTGAGCTLTLTLLVLTLLEEDPPVPAEGLAGEGGGGCGGGAGVVCWAAGEEPAEGCEEEAGGAAGCAVDGACVAGEGEEYGRDELVGAEGEEEGGGEVDCCEGEGTPGDVPEEPWPSAAVVWLCEEVPAAVVVDSGRAGVVSSATQASEELAPMGDVDPAGHSVQSAKAASALNVPGWQSWQFFKLPEYPGGQGMGQHLPVHVEFSSNLNSVKASVQVWFTLQLDSTPFTET